MKSKYIFWDWKETAPLAEIFKAVKKIKNAKLWSINDGSYYFCVIVAATKKDALNIWIKTHQEWLTDLKNAGEKPEDVYPEMTIWED